MNLLDTFCLLVIVAYHCLLGMIIVAYHCLLGMVIVAYLVIAPSWFLSLLKEQSAPRVLFL